MHITEVEALHLRLPEVKAVADGTQECLIVRVHTDAGISGLGEVVSAAYVARAVIEAPMSAPFRHGLAAILQGMDPLDMEQIWRAMERGTSWYGPGGVVRHALSGIDMALWDIRGKAEGKPLRTLLSPDAVDIVPCYASILWPALPDQVARSAHSFLEQGYRAVKYGWAPMGPDPALDEALVAAARSALGDSMELMVDAGRAWDAETALARAHSFRPYRLSWLEEPLDPWDMTGYHALASASPIPIAGGELYSLPQEYQTFVAGGHIAVVQPDLGRVGGITGGREIARLAMQRGTRPVPHAYGTGILLAASAQWAASLPQPLTEYTRSESPLARNLVRHALRFQDGALHLSDAPGLGVELDQPTLERFRI